MEPSTSSERSVPNPAVPRDDVAALRQLSRAIELQQHGRLDDAERVYAALLAVDDTDPTLLVNAGALSLARNDIATSVARLERAVAVAPENAIAQGNLGFALIRAGRDAEALVTLDRAVALKPGFAQAHNNRGIALVRLRRRDEAIAAFERALAVQPAFVDAAINLGEVHNRAGDTMRARDAFSRVPPGHPAFASARVGLAFADALDGALGPATSALESLVAEQPKLVAAWHTLGAVRNWAWRHDEAERAFRQALALDPTHADARFGLASALLARGRYAEGFDAFDASRANAAPRAGVLGTLPPWRGEALDGTLVVHGEQGLGDVVQFARFIAGARPRVRRIVVLLDGYWRPLAPLFATLGSVDAVISDANALPAEAPRARVSVLSLARLVDADIDSLPAPPYLSAPQDRRASWRDTVGRFAAPRVGLAWSVFARDDHGYVSRHKSIAPEALAPILDIEGVSFFSLQPGVAGDTARLGTHASRVVGSGASIGDFGDTAALIDALDLVISVDTAVAHVAGALAKPVWLLERFHGCWRWRAHAERSPWYPTLRLFRQDRFDDWRDAIARVARALQAWRDTRG